MTSLPKLTCFEKFCVKDFVILSIKHVLFLLFVVTNFQDIGYEVGLFMYFLF